jgi:hypothetical protein
MSKLQLYRGPPVELVYKKRLGSPLSVSLVVGDVLYLHAAPSDFMALQRWLESEAAALKEFMLLPEDQTQSENMRGDAQGE